MSASRRSRRLEPVRKGLIEITAEDGVVRRALLYRGEGEEKT